DLDYYGNIYVTDKAHHCIHKFSGILRYLTSYGRYGTGDKEFIEPRGIAIYRRFGQLFIGEAMGAQYYWVGVDVFNFQMRYESERNWVHCEYFLTEPAYLTVDVFDKQGVWVTRVFSKRFLFSGVQEDNWSARIYALQVEPDEGIVSDGSSFYANLKFIPKGRYTVRYKFEPTYSSYHYFAKEFEREIEIRN
ncbi:hypothetical protein JW964_12800, partial [candidate division KSB1 bacterium]|nr:hypothetical protein [candidate division KSB1 bacterium]